MNRSREPLLASHASRKSNLGVNSMRDHSTTVNNINMSGNNMDNLCALPNTASLRSSRETCEMKKRRLVSKAGEVRVLSRNVPNRTKLYLADIFTTMIDMHWKWIFVLFLVSYVLTWAVFATIWWIIVRVRGTGVCLEEVDGWTSAYLFSLETQQTIGYGHRSISTKCAEAVIVLQAQTVVGIIVDAFMLGLTFAKLSRPRERALTCSFSKHAVITLRNGKMCLMFRVADIRKSQIVEAHIRLQMFREIKTDEGHRYPFYQEDLKICYNPDDYMLKNEDNRNQIFLLFPLVIVHVIEEGSPFYELNPESLKETEFELVVVLDGIVEATGMNTQPKTSYLPDEILWGFNFANVADQSQTDKKGCFWWDYSKFDEVYRIPETPMCSPKEYYRGRSIVRENLRPGTYI